MSILFSRISPYEVLEIDNFSLLANPLLDKAYIKIITIDKRQCVKAVRLYSNSIQIEKDLRIA